MGYRPSVEPMMTSPDDASVRRLVGLVLRAAERGETAALLESVSDPAGRLFLQELAACAGQSRLLPTTPPYPMSGELSMLNPTSAELLLEEQLEEELTLADPVETQLLVWLSQQGPSAAQDIWERALTLLADELPAR